MLMAWSGSVVVCVDCNDNDDDSSSARTELGHDRQL